MRFRQITIRSIADSAIHQVRLRSKRTGTSGVGPLAAIAPRAGPGRNAPKPVPVRREPTRPSNSSTGAPVIYETAQSSQPSREAPLFKVSDPALPLISRTVECRGPLDKCALTGGYRHNPKSRDVVLDWKRRRVAECVGEAPLDIGVGEQHLADDGCPAGEPTHS